MAKNDEKWTILDLPTLYIYNKQLFLPSSDTNFQSDTILSSKWHSSDTNIGTKCHLIKFNSIVIVVIVGSVEVNRV